MLEIGEPDQGLEVGLSVKPAGGAESSLVLEVVALRDRGSLGAHRMLRGHPTRDRLQGLRASPAQGPQVVPVHADGVGRIIPRQLRFLLTNDPAVVTDLAEDAQQPREVADSLA